MKHSPLFYIKNPLRTIKGFIYKHSDRYAIKKIWKSSMGYTLDINHPKTLNEKLQWLKLYDHNPLYTILADKYELKTWLTKNIGTQYVVPNYGTYGNVGEIELENLPNEFVIKCNHDSGSVYICMDKAKDEFVDKKMNHLGWEEVKQRLDEKLKINYYEIVREWPYKNIKPLILVESILRNDKGAIPNDIKIFYANGNFLFTYVSFDREGLNDRCMYDINWNRLPFVWVTPKAYRKDINTAEVPCPKNYKKMIDVGKKIASYCKFVRIDFYDLGENFLIGEVTFFHGGGYDRFYPNDYDLIYGQKLNLK